MPCREDALTTPGGRASRDGRSGGRSGWTPAQLAAMADVKERCWEEQVEEGNPHLMPSFVAAAHSHLRALPPGAPLDYEKLRGIFAAAADPHDAGSAAWQAQQEARKRRREAAAAEADSSGGGGWKRRRQGQRQVVGGRCVVGLRRGSSGGLGACMLGGFSGCVAEE